MSLGKQSAPAAPDYTGAANATAAGNLKAAQVAQQANMTNQYTPYGSLTYSQDATSRFGSDPSYSANIDLSPTGQKLLDNQNNAAIGLGDATNSALGRVQDTMGKPMDQSSVQGVADQAYKNYTSRLDPQWQHNQETTENQLVNQGLRPGTEAYDNAMRDFNQAKNDAYTTANTASINTMPQTYQLDSSIRNQPLNELNALRTGSQVTNPQFSSTPQQQTTAGPDLFGATNSLYGNQLNSVNANNANSSNFYGGLLKTGAMAAIMMSDERLKTDVEKVGKLDNGLNVYKFRYKSGGPMQIGVMAQEVEKVIPEAVQTMGNGYKAVNYGLL